MQWMHDFTKSEEYAKSVKEITLGITKILQQQLIVQGVEIKQLHTQVSVLENTIKKQQDDINVLKESLIHQEKLAKRNNIKIDGLEENHNEKNTKEVVTVFIKSNMHLKIKNEDILSAERMGLRKTGDKKPRRILVKFNSVWSKKRCMLQQKSTKGYGPTRKGLHQWRLNQKDIWNIFPC